MHTTSTHRFHNHTTDALSDNLCVHVLRSTVHRSAFAEAVFLGISDVNKFRFVLVISDGY